MAIRGTASQKVTLDGAQLLLKTHGCKRYIVAIKYEGEEESSQDLILSLLSDHCLFLHPQQKALIDNQLPALTIGSLRDLERINAVIESIQSLVSFDKASPFINSISAKVAEVITLRQSAKHMSGRDLGKLEPSESLKYQKSA
ncbi:hypothetical protein [Legionella longbeachae]|uniref:hypothetical protein n=1 Tax=Legionella longbeachae TaxID=450 RepID=UPI0012492501|nr:hypothetical protein [Legionella longbeachae]QEY52108.1 hypothetical protein FQU71_13210 [Legionella longbeachae]